MLLKLAGIEPVKVNGCGSSKGSTSDSLSENHSRCSSQSDEVNEIAIEMNTLCSIVEPVAENTNVINLRASDEKSDEDGNNANASASEDLGI